MSQSISNGLSVDIPVQATHALKLAWLGGTYTAQIISGVANVPVALATNSASSQTFGPYAKAIMVRLTVSAIGRVAWDTDSTPVFIPPGEQFTRQDDGIPVTLSGVGPAAAFAVDRDGNLLASSGVASSVTGTTTETILASFVIPAGSMQANSILEFTHLWSVTNNANAKNAKIKIGAVIVYQNQLPSMGSCQTYTALHSRNSLKSQVSAANSVNSSIGSSSAAPNVYSIDFSVEQTVTFTCSLANAADSAALEMFVARVAG